ncbi:hypothetical protein NDU88_003846 [Pleurodeles waltl]|uniref:Uncharacterized protein n=1 Tax=Pleurodeles waltl TaxID=8319 RepID=A0AAV7KW35_PLEWA|nr:hypothetical protein NDU88_003846 [Pleurodeles waltl]
MGTSPLRTKSIWALRASNHSECGQAECRWARPARVRRRAGELPFVAWTEVGGRLAIPARSQTGPAPAPRSLPSEQVRVCIDTPAPGICARRTAPARGCGLGCCVVQAGPVDSLRSVPRDLGT